MRHWLCVYVLYELVSTHSTIIIIFQQQQQTHRTHYAFYILQSVNSRFPKIKHELNIWNTYLTKKGKWNSETYTKPHTYTHIPAGSQQIVRCYGMVCSLERKGNERMTSISLFFGKTLELDTQYTQTWNIFGFHGPLEKMVKNIYWACALCTHRTYNA